MGDSYTMSSSGGGIAVQADTINFYQSGNLPKRYLVLAILYFMAGDLAYFSSRIFGEVGGYYDGVSRMLHF